MMKYKGKIMISSLVILCTMFLGIALWGKLPDTIATHFNSSNAADGWSSKTFTVFGLPLFLLGAHLLCVFITFNDPKKKNIGEKMMGFIIWLIPAVSVGTMAFLYMNALGMKVNIGMVMNILMGILFVIIGNYLPKCRQNYTVGIKLPWTLNSTENWNRTHRLAGWLFIICGALFFANAFLAWGGAGVIVIMTVAAVIPTVYSFILYKKGV